MNRKAAVSLTAALLLFVSIAGCISRSSDEKKEEIDIKIPIIISSNSDFISKNGISDGTGTSEDPFIIEDIVADPQESRYCILVKDTNAHFMIRNCTFKNASIPMFQDMIWPPNDYYDEAGMIFENVSNAIISRNVIRSNQGMGIIIRRSSSVSIIENEIIENGGNGIFIEGRSSDIEVIRNDISLNSQIGIQSVESSIVRINSNHLEENYQGISIRDVTGTKIENNTFAQQGLTDLNIESSTNMEISSNRIKSQRWEGVVITDSDDISFENNQFIGTGLELDSCCRSILVNNTFGGVGIILNGDIREHYDSHSMDMTNTVISKPIHYISNQENMEILKDIGQLIVASSFDFMIDSVELKTETIIAFSENVSVLNSSFSSPLGNGLRLIHSNRITIERNHFEKNHLFGLYLWNSSWNTIYNNGFYKNGNNTNGGGIGLLEGSSNNDITRNMIDNNTWNGMYLQRAVDNSLTGNQISNQYFGINVDVISDHNSIEGNNIQENRVGMINRDSSNNTYKNNSCSNNEWIGMIIRNSKNNVLSNNRYNDNHEGIWLDEADLNLLRENQFNRNGYGTNFDGIGIKLERSSFNILSKNSINLNNGDGIWLRDRCSNNKLNSNEVMNNWGGGINIFISSSWNKIVKNTCNENERGIVVQGSTGNEIFDNYCGNNSNCGIFVGHQSENNSIMNNLCFNGSFYGIEIYSSKENQIIFNTCISFRVGIRMSDSDDCIIRKNSCMDNNESGILIFYSDECSINMNAMSQNEIGLKIDNSSGNDIHHNAFIGNNIQAISNMANDWDDGQGEGNYWDDYSGLDNGADGRFAGDGIGDIGLPHLGLDNYPLMENPFAPQT